MVNICVQEVTLQAIDPTKEAAGQSGICRNGNSVTILLITQFDQPIDMC